MPRLIVGPVLPNFVSYYWSANKVIALTSNMLNIACCHRLWALDTTYYNYYHVFFLSPTIMQHFTCGITISNLFIGGNFTLKFLNRTIIFPRHTSLDTSRPAK